MRTACFHCGEPCDGDSFARQDKVFCCQGCLVVHDLLAESGLGHFYDLGRHPGARVRGVASREKWAYLEEPPVQQRLLDFTDGKTSRVTFHVPTIHCVACVWLLENLFRLHPGVGRAQVNFPRREVAISFATEKISLSELVALLASIGYEPVLTLGELEKRAANPTGRRQWLQLGVAGFAFGNIMLFSVPAYLGFDSLSAPVFKIVFGCLSLLLALPVLTYSASDYWRSARLSLKQRRLTLDVPIALGLLALYGQSAFEILSGRGGGYLDSLSGLVFFLLCGRVFQQKTHERLAFDRDYKSFFPLSVTRIGSEATECWSNGAMNLTATSRAHHSNPPLLHHPLREERISLSQLQVGDRIVIRNGELIPADARVVNGPACIDYSFVTGEAEPVEKKEGDYLYAGGKQLGGVIEVETVKAVSQSYLTSLWNHEAFRKNRGDDLNTLTNRYSMRFTVMVVGVAIGAALVWLAVGDPGRAIKAFVSVLIVACPCALALAAPFTLGTAQRCLARLNAFLKNALVLERLAEVDAIVFDKTGTLTAAGANSATFAGAPLSDEEERWIYSIARHSTHPHSARISATLADRHSPEPVRGFLETPGCGIEANVRGHEVCLGSRAWLQSRGVNVDGILLPESPRTVTKALEDSKGLCAVLPHPGLLPLGEGETAVSACTDRARQVISTRRLTVPPLPAGEGRGEGEPRDLPKERALSKQCEFQIPLALPSGSTVSVAIDGKLRGAYVLASSLRPEADQLLRRLGARYEVALLSGDNETERARFRGLFSDGARLHFNQSPLDKLSFIRRLQEAGRTVMMVGDGLNDAGALKQSDVGVAVVEKIGAFSPASDVIFDAAQVHRLADILDFARKATHIVRASFVISALYNAVGVSIAAAGLLSPLVCAILMPLSSVSVVLFACGVTTWAARRTGLTTMPKSEIRGPKEIRSPDSEVVQAAQILRNSDVSLPSDFALRTSVVPKP